MSKPSIHTVYRTKDGKRVPSVTTVLGILNKPALLDWAWRCGIDGKDYKAVRDNAADIGTLAHYLIMCHLKDITPDTSKYSANDIGQAKTCLLKYWEWEKENKVEPILIEEPLVSESYGFGGTIDCLALLNGTLTLIDHKTGRGIYPEMFYQLAAYRQLLEENSYKVAGARILRIGRNDQEGFEQRAMDNLDTQWKIFYHCLGIYKLR